MYNPAEFLTGYRRAVRLQEDMLREVGQRFGLSLIEATILCFLRNNPEMDTAADVATYRMLSKGNVSQAVDSLVGHGLLERTQDVHDRRQFHLTLTEKASDIAEALVALNHKLDAIMFEGVTNEERELYHRVSSKVTENLMRKRKAEAE